MIISLILNPYFMEARETVVRLRERSDSLMTFTRMMYTACFTYPEVKAYVDSKSALYESDEGDGELLYFCRAWNHSELV